MATDRGSPKLAGSATVTVIIVDLNDNSPTIPLPREVRVPESEWANMPFALLYIHFIFTMLHVFVLYEHLCVCDSF